MNEDARGCGFVILGLIIVIGIIVAACNIAKDNDNNGYDSDEKIESGTYSATVIGRHEYRKTGNHSETRSDTITVIK